MIGKLSTIAMMAGLVSASPINLSRSPSSSFGNSLSNSFGNSFGSSFGNSFSNSFSSLNFEEVNFVDFSFNNFDNFNDFSSFDNFFGQSNFLGLNNEIIVIDVEQPTCRATDINVIQQQLSILLETMKQIFVSEFCDVELQVITLEQFMGRMDSFSRSLRRETSFPPSYDSSVSVLITEIVVDGNLNTNNFGFNGNSIGSNSVVFSGNNWGSNSINSVGLAYQLAHQSRIASLNSFGDSSQSSSQLSNIGSSQLSNIGSSQLSNASNSQLSNVSNSSVDSSTIDSASYTTTSVDPSATDAALASASTDGSSPDTASEVTANGSGFK